MLRFAPNLHHLFTELPFRQRFAAAAKLGFDAVEWHFPYEISSRDLKGLLEDNGLRFTYGVVPADWENGNYGLGAQPGKEDAFRRAADLALGYAFNVPYLALNVGHGVLPDDVDRERCLETYARNLQYVCDQAIGTELKIVIEPVTKARFGLPFVLATMEQAAKLHRIVDRSNLKLVFDTYHLRMEEAGALSDILNQYWSLIGHIQFGNAPTRNEPGVGEIDFDFLIRCLENRDYDGWIGLEFDPSKDTWSSLTWLNTCGYAIDPKER